MTTSTQFTRRHRRRAALALTITAATVALATPAGAADLPLARGREVAAGPLSIVNAVNDDGIAGGATAATVAALWSRDTGRVRELGVLPGSYGSVVHDVDRRGRAVGVAYGYLGVYTSHAFRWTPSGGLVDLGTLGGADSWATTGNDAGQVTGSSALPGGAASHAFRWTAGGGMTDLGTLPGYPSSIGAGIDEDGTIVGSSTRIEDGPTGMRFISRGTVWVPGRAPLDIGGLGGDLVEPAAISADGQVAGVATTADGTRQVFRWSRRTGMVALGPVGPDVNVRGMTDSGMIVGFRRISIDPNDFRSRPFLFTPACGFRDLPVATGPEASGFVTAVNDRGLVYGTVHDRFADPYRVFAWDAARRPC
jgi:probable HAF family extracellular repeat protein